jgi:hypothetical protein
MMQGDLLIMKFLDSSCSCVVPFYDKLLGLSEREEELVGARTCVGRQW